MYIEVSDEQQRNTKHIIKQNKSTIMSFVYGNYRLFISHLSDTSRLLWNTTRMNQFVQKSTMNTSVSAINVSMNAKHYKTFRPRPTCHLNWIHTLHIPDQAHYIFLFCYQCFISYWSIVACSKNVSEADVQLFLVFFVYLFGSISSLFFDDLIVLNVPLSS